jgi:hypothetical protein
MGHSIPWTTPSWQPVLKFTTKYSIGMSFQLAYLIYHGVLVSLLEFTSFVSSWTKSYCATARSINMIMQCTMAATSVTVSQPLLNAAGRGWYVMVSGLWGMVLSALSVTLLRWKGLPMKEGTWFRSSCYQSLVRKETMHVHCQLLYQLFVLGRSKIAQGNFPSTEWYNGATRSCSFHLLGTPLLRQG